MTIEQIQQRSRELHNKTRRELIRRIAVPLVVICIAGFGSTWSSAPVARLGFVIAVTWSLIGQYFIHRGIRTTALPEYGIDAYRMQVERQRHLFANFLLWLLGPIVLALGTFVLPLLRLGIERGMMMNMIPFLALLGIWIVAVFFVRMQDQRALRREIAELGRLTD